MIENPAPVARLCVLGGFELVAAGTPTRLPVASQRLLALLALSPGRGGRGVIAARLWPDLPEGRAAAALRTLLWQVRRGVPGTVVDRRGSPELSGTVRVDLHEALRASRCPEPLPPGELDASFGHDVLPDWTEEWVLGERERFRQVRLHALETACACLTREGRHAEAIAAALGAVAADPLRESAQRALIEAHLAEGNVSEAVRQYRAFARDLSDSLGVAPTPGLATLIPVPPVRLRGAARA